MLVDGTIVTVTETSSPLYTCKLTILATRRSMAQEDWPGEISAGPRFSDP
jgi:hypothetical protein